MGKPDEGGFYTSGNYQMQPSANKNSGKVDWIKVIKTSGETFTDEDAEVVYQSLTGRKRSEVSNPPSLHKDDTMLLMVKPKRK